MVQAVGAIGQLFALCGVSCMRNFIPTFVFLLLAATLPKCSFCPDALRQCAASVPESLLGGWSLLFFGVLALAELYANWNATIREMLDDANWEKYFKPAYAFIFAMIMGTPEAAEATAQVANQVSQVSNAVAESPSQVVGWMGDAVVSGLAAAGTAYLCDLKCKIVEILRSLDPDNSFKLHTFAALVEESAWFLLLIVVVVLPALAIVLVLLMAAAAWAFRKALKKMEMDRSHACPDCGQPVHNSAVVCPSCHAAQPTPYHKVGMMGLADAGLVDLNSAYEVHEHHSKLLMVHRCPLCATPLKDKLTCGGCAGDVWGQGFSRGEMIKKLDQRVLLCGVLAIAISWVPFLGFFLPIFFLNVFAIRVLRAYESRWSRAFGNFVIAVIKMIFLLIVFCFSAIPFVGFLALVPYFLSYLMRRNKFLK